MLFLMLLGFGEKLHAINSDLPLLVGLLSAMSGILAITFKNTGD